MLHDSDLTAALRAEAEQAQVPADRILLQIRRSSVRLAKASIWERLGLGKKFEIVAACVLLAGVIGVAAIRNLPGKAVGNGDQLPAGAPVTKGVIPQVKLGDIEVIQVTVDGRTALLQDNQLTQMGAAGQLVEALNLLSSQTLKEGMPKASPSTTVKVNLKGQLVLTVGAFGNNTFAVMTPDYRIYTAEDMVLAKAVSRLEHDVTVPNQSAPPARNMMDDQEAQIVAKYHDPRAAEEKTTWGKPKLIPEMQVTENGKTETHAVWEVPGTYADGGKIVVQLDAYTRKLLSATTSK